MGKGEDEMFLVGVAMPSSELGQPPKEFYSFARVGSGFQTNNFSDYSES